MRSPRCPGAARRSPVRPSRARRRNSLIERETVSPASRQENAVASITERLRQSLLSDVRAPMVWSTAAFAQLGMVIAALVAVAAHRTYCDELDPADPVGGVPRTPQALTTTTSGNSTEPVADAWRVRDGIAGAKGLFFP